MKIEYLKTQIVTVVTIALAAFFLLLASNSYGGQVAHVDEACFQHKHLLHWRATSAYLAVTFLCNNAASFNTTRALLSEFKHSVSC